MVVSNLDSHLTERC